MRRHLPARCGKGPLSPHSYHPFGPHRLSSADPIPTTWQAGRF